MTSWMPPRGGAFQTTCIIALTAAYWPIMAAESSEKTVLVKLETLSQHGTRNRPVTFSGGKEELLCATKDKFGDILSKDGDIYLQILDQSWGDEVFVDLQNQDIPSRSILKAVETKV